MTAPVSIAAAVVDRMRERWAQVQPDDLDGSWGQQVPGAVQILAAGQILAATQADLQVTNAVGRSDLRVNAPGFAGRAADGRPLVTLLEEPVIAVKTAILAGQALDEALGRGLIRLTMAAGTEVTDAGRLATGAAITARPQVHGYVRVVNAPACGRCIVLAGRVYRWSDGFQRHPRCLPAGVVVSGPRRLATTRRWYQGELVVIRTASGQELPVTGNHPVLTDCGWLPANLIQEGDHVLRSTSGQGGIPLVVPDEHEVPSRIEDLWRPGGVMPLLQMPTSAEDFHGDGMDGQVDVVLADGFLRDDDGLSLSDPVGQQLLAVGVEAAAPLAGLGSSQQEFQGLGYAADRIMGSGHLPGSLLRSHSTGPVQARRLPTARFDPPVQKFSAESAPAYTQVGLDLQGRLTGQVEPDRVVQVGRRDFRGHVYNLNSAEGWYVAGGLIVSNCDCQMVPAQSGDTKPPQSPRDLFDAMDSSEQEKAFTVAGAKAIRDGADLSRVVNAQRGMYEAGGRSLTTEATTRRGRLPGQPAGGRLTPRQIYREAGDDRAEAIRLLRRFGYLTG